MNLNDANNCKFNNISLTIFGNHPYNELWYVDDKNKICFTFSPRAGCSIVFQQFLELTGHLEEGQKYSNFIHDYRVEVIMPIIKRVPIEDLQQSNFTFIKFIMNPYIRAVSIFRSQSSHNLSFREYLKQLVNNEISYFNDNDKFHIHPQYIEGEEHIITKYVKIDEYEKYTITLHDGTPYELDVNKFTSFHHGVKTENTHFHGDIPVVDIRDNLPKSYKYFYDDEIRKMVEIYYKDDIEKYGFKFFDE